MRRRVEGVGGMLAEVLRPDPEIAALWRATMTTTPAVWAWMAADATGDRIREVRRAAWGAVDDVLGAGAREEWALSARARLGAVDVMHPTGGVAPGEWRPHVHMWIPAVAIDADGRVRRLGRTIPRRVQHEVAEAWRARLGDLTGIALPRLRVSFGFDAGGAPGAVRSARTATLTRDLRGFPGWSDLPAAASTVAYRGFLASRAVGRARAALEDEAIMLAEMGAAVEPPPPEPETHPAYTCGHAHETEPGARCGRPMTIFPLLTLPARRRALAATGDGYRVSEAEAVWHDHATERSEDPQHEVTCFACRSVGAAVEREVERNPAAREARWRPILDAPGVVGWTLRTIYRALGLGTPDLARPLHTLILERDALGEQLDRRIRAARSAERRAA